MRNASTCLRRVPWYVPLIATPRICGHRLPVSRSYMTLLFERRRPELPNVSTRPSYVRSKTSAVPHRGQRETTMGTPPTTSFTTSCQCMSLSGYVRDSLPIVTPTTSSHAYTYGSASNLGRTHGRRRTPGAL